MMRQGKERLTNIVVKEDTGSSGVEILETGDIVDFGVYDYPLCMIRIQLRDRHSSADSLPSHSLYYAAVQDDNLSYRPMKRLGEPAHLRDLFSGDLSELLNRH